MIWGIERNPSHCAFHVNTKRFFKNHSLITELDAKKKMEEIISFCFYQVTLTARQLYIYQVSQLLTLHQNIYNK